MAHAPRSNSRQAIVFSVVVLFHILIYLAIKSGLASSLVDMLKGPMEASLIEQAQQEKEAPPPPPPKFQALPPPVEIPLDINVEAPPPDTSNAIQENAPRKAAPVAPSAPVATVPPRSNPRRPVTQPDYPPTSKRLGEHGTVVMLLTVDESGKVTEAKLDKSSGFDRLDQAALEEALKNWRLLPGTIGGKPTTMQYKFAVVFRIEDEK